jgi:hypothetical protein
MRASLANAALWSFARVRASVGRAGWREIFFENMVGVIS